MTQNITRHTLLIQISPWYMARCHNNNNNNNNNNYYYYYYYYYDNAPYIRWKLIIIVMIVIAFRCRKSITTSVRWGITLSSINTGLVAKAYGGTTTISRMSLWYPGPLRLLWTVSDQIQLAIMHSIPTASQNHRHHHRHMEWFLGCPSDILAHYDCFEQWPDPTCNHAQHPHSITEPPPPPPPHGMVSWMSLWYPGPLRLLWTVTRSNLQSCTASPQHHRTTATTTATWNGFLDVPLISWPITIALNSDQIQLAIMHIIPTASQNHRHHHRHMEWFLGCPSDILAHYDCFEQWPDPTCNHAHHPHSITERRPPHGMVSWMLLGTRAPPTHPRLKLKSLLFFV